MGHCHNDLSVMLLKILYDIFMKKPILIVSSVDCREKGRKQRNWCKWRDEFVFRFANALMRWSCRWKGVYVLLLDCHSEILKKKEIVKFKHLLAEISKDNQNRNM